MNCLLDTSGDILWHLLYKLGFVKPTCKTVGLDQTADVWNFHSVWYETLPNLQQYLCLRLFYLSSHTPWADFYLDNFLLFILWEPYIKEKSAQEERTGILSVLWSLMQFSSWGDLSPSVQKIWHQSCTLSQVRLLRIYSILFCDHWIWSTSVRMMFAVVIWGHFCLTLFLWILCPHIPAQKAVEQRSSAVLFPRPCHLLYFLLGIFGQQCAPHRSFQNFSWSFLYPWGVKPEVLTKGSPIRLVPTCMPKCWAHPNLSSGPTQV